MIKPKCKNYKFLIAGVIVIWAGIAFLTSLGGEDWTTRGQIGDMFGAVNSLFSGLAFAGLLVAILMQRTELRMQRVELRLQRKELTLTRRELKRSASAQEESEKALRRQAESLKNTAAINALDTLIRVSGEENIREVELGGSGAEFKIKKQQLVEQLESILAEGC